MVRPSTYLPARRALWIVGALVLMSGCWCKDYWLVDKSTHGTPPALPEPNGAFVNRWANAQATKAEASDFVFFQDEWYMNGPTLGPYGHRHLLSLLLRLPIEPFPVVVQRTIDPGVDEARGKFLVEMLTKYGVPDAEKRVVVGDPIAEGLYGEEGERFFINMLTTSSTGFSGPGRIGLYSGRGLGFGGYGGGLYGGGLYGGGLYGGGFYGSGFIGRGFGLGF